MTLWIGESHLVDHVEAFNAIVVRYYASTEASEGVPPIDFDWPMYLGLEKVGGTLFVVALDGGRLLGGCLYMVGPHPHHRTVTVAGCDTLAVDTAARGRGIGRQLVQAAEPLLAARGVKIVSHGFRHCYAGATPLFPALGYASTETVFLKQVG